MSGLGGLYPSDSLRPPQTAARQAPLAKGFSRPEYWSGVPFPPPGGIFPSQGLNSRLLGLLRCRWILHPQSRREALRWRFPAAQPPLLPWT